MAVSDIEAVLEFLRKNGFSESESALMEDVLEKSELKSFDFEKFLFPMGPPLNIPASRRRPADRVGGGDSGYGSSDEFVSLGSSTSDVCSSEFTNPYGVRTAAGVSSRSSSDRLSQFGTAREYQDFDMQNELYWYNEKDEDFTTPPYFGGSDLFICPSEDKFIMTSEAGKSSDSQLCHNNMSEGCQIVDRSNNMDKPWPFNVSSINDVNGVQVTSYHNVKENVGDRGADIIKEGSVDYSCPSLFCAQNLDGGVLSKITKNENDYYEGGNEIEVAINNNEPEDYIDGEEATTADQLLIYDAIEDEHEVFNLRIIHRKNRTGFEENKDLPILLNSIIAGRYYVSEYLGSAAFSRVVQAHDMLMGVDVCLKIIKNDKDFFDQSLDEIKLLKFVNKHDPGDEHHILRLYDYFYCQEHLFIVCELLRANLYEFQKYNQESGGEPYFTLSRIQLITRQCLEALEYLHHLGIIHCDLKPENILMKSYRRCEVKVIDLGSSCFQTDNLCLYIQSRSYRAPEVILGLPYDQRIDLWSLGCILVELCSGEVLFPNDALVLLLARMIGMLGPIDMDMLSKGQETHKYFTEDYELLYLMNEGTNQPDYIIPEKLSLEDHLQVSDHGFINFVRYLLVINPQKRPTAREALEHPWLSHKYKL